MKVVHPPLFFKLIPFCALIFLALGCEMFETVESTKIPQDEIRQHYVVAATSAETHVKAYFTQGGWTKSVDLDAPSKIEHNGAELPQKTILFGGPVYEMSFSRLETEHSFVYTNNDRRVFRNQLSFQPLELPAGEIAISRAAETRIRLSRAVGRDETISIALESARKPTGAAESNDAPEKNKVNAPDYEIALNDELDESRAVLVLKPKNLKNFAPGKAVLRVSVGGSPSPAQSTAAGAALSWTYSSTRGAVVSD